MPVNRLVLNNLVPRVLLGMQVLSGGSWSCGFALLHRFFWAIEQFIILLFWCSWPETNKHVGSYIILPFPALPQNRLFYCLWAIKWNHMTMIHQGAFVPKSTLGMRLDGKLVNINDYVENILDPPPPILNGPRIGAQLLAKCPCVDLETSLESFCWLPHTKYCMYTFWFSPIKFAVNRKAYGSRCFLQKMWCKTWLDVCKYGIATLLRVCLPAEQIIHSRILVLLIL